MSEMIIIHRVDIPEAFVANSVLAATQWTLYGCWLDAAVEL